MGKQPSGFAFLWGGQRETTDTWMLAVRATWDLSFNAAILIECSMGFFSIVIVILCLPVVPQALSCAAMLPLAAPLTLGEGARPSIDLFPQPHEWNS